MKQKFFTLLLGLAMVSLGAVAEDIEMNAVGAKTYMSTNNLDFSSLNETRKTLIPYYISSYSNKTGKFTLARFTDDRVPAYTPMILLLAYPDEWVSGTKYTVDTYSTTALVLDDARNPVYANENINMIPVTSGSYVNNKSRIVYPFTPDSERALIGASEAGKYIVKQTIDIKSGTDTIHRHYPYYTQKNAESLVGSVGDTIIVKTSSFGKFIYAMTWAYDEDEEDYTWVNISSTPLTVEDNNDAGGAKEGWFLVRDVDVTTNYTQFILGESGGNAVFKRCTVAGNKVRENACFVRVNTGLVPTAAAAREIGFTFDDEEDAIIGQDEATGIKSVKNNVKSDVYFNMNGQKLDKIQKGLNIVNGKKVFVR